MCKKNIIEHINESIFSLKNIKPFDLYLISLIGINVYGSYQSSKKYLINFRENKLNNNEVFKIHDEWEAVKYGSYHNLYERIINSLFWPLTLPLNLIPWIALKMNSKKSIETIQNNKSKENSEKLIEINEEKN